MTPIRGGVWTLLKEGHFLEATETADNVGQEVEPGLPNLKGYSGYNMGGTDGKLFQHNGLIYYLEKTYGHEPYYSNLNMDASRLNSIYGSSETVQPKSIRCFIWRRVS